MRLRTSAVLLLAALAAGCTYPLYGARPLTPAGTVVAHTPPPPPVGRWDNVMILDAGTWIRVLNKDGTRTDGRFQSADGSALRVEAGGETGWVLRSDVARVDRLVDAVRAGTAGVLRGVLTGLGAVGILGLSVGQVPAARHWAAGAIGGGYAGAQAGALAAGPTTIYLAPPDGPGGPAPADSSR